MINYWWVTRPKRKLDSVPEVLAAFADLSLNQVWDGQRDTHIAYEEALEAAGLKRKGERRDQTGGGGRTYQAWLESLGLIFKHGDLKQVKLTLAGEAIMAGESPVVVLRNQVLKYQFPSAFSVSRGVNMNPRFKIRPFRFLLKLLSDSRVLFLKQDEIAKIIVTEAEDESDKCYEYIVDRIWQYRAYGDSCLASDFAVKYAPSKGVPNFDEPAKHLLDLANTLINWIEYTQLAHRDDDGVLRILPEMQGEVDQILSYVPPFIDRPGDHEFFQRKYGIDPKHRKDTRNLDQTKTVTAKIIAEQKIRQAYIMLSMVRPITHVTYELINDISNQTGIAYVIVEDTLQKAYPHGSIGAFMSSYFEMAFQGRENAIEFEKATTTLFRDVFGYNAVHLGQTGSKSAPDILLLSDSDGYQAIIDNKAYSKYSISGDHHNRMVHNYIENLRSYSDSGYPLGFFAYIAGGFAPQIDRQIMKISEESHAHGSGIIVSNMIKMVEQNSQRPYTHADLRKIFSVDRQIRIGDF